MSTDKNFVKNILVDEVTPFIYSKDIPGSN